MSKLDQVVKGAPPPGSHFPPESTSPITSIELQETPNLSDPLASLPSSPPQIYLNLLILEASLRAQWLQLRMRRRQHTFFLTLLALWIVYFGYALFFAPREDGSGVGGSVYWVVEVAEKVCFMGGIVTGILVWGTGQWERGVRWPRRWVGTTNRGLRGFNCKLVIIKESWPKAIISTLSFFLSSSLFSGSRRSSYRYVDQALLLESEKSSHSTGHHALPTLHPSDDAPGWEEDLAPGGDFVKLLLLPKPFSPHFRENWETYRTEYWEKENERRATMREKLASRERQAAKDMYGWLWWTAYRPLARDLEKSHFTPSPSPNPQHHVHRHNSLEKDTHKRGKSGSIRSGSHSRTSSRNSTPTDNEDVSSGSVGHTRTSSTVSIASERRKKRGQGKALGPAGAKAAAPDVRSPLAREGSATSASSLDSERTGTGGDTESARSLRGVRPGGGASRMGTGEGVR